MATCSVCASTFEAHRSDARYCSPACRQTGRRSGVRVHDGPLNVTEGQSATPAASGAVLSGTSPTSEAPTRRLSRAAIPDVEPCRAPVYAAGSLHGPVYDAKGNVVHGPVPEIVGYLGTDGRLERIARR